MKFQRVPLAEARGHILGHNVSRDGRRVLRKGRRLGEAELLELSSLGLDGVYVAQLDPSDVDEDQSAERIADVLAATGNLVAHKASGGRVSLRAPGQGVVSIRRELLLELNLIPGVTLATLPEHSVVVVGQTLATLKVIPFALVEASVVAAERLAAQGLLCFQSFARQRVRILVSGAEGRRERLLGAYRDPLLRRLEALGVTDVGVEYVSLGGEPERTLAAALGQHLDVGVELIIMVGETATMDAEDLTPRAIRQAHGTVEVVGAPVFPGNLLLLGYSGRSAILGAPGCVRSRARNVVDLILPRLLLGERLGARHIAELGLGGLLGGSEHGEGGDTAGREHE